MKAITLSTIALMAAALCAGIIATFTVLQPAGASNQWLLKEKRSIATQLCVAMVRSGAYTGYDDNQLSDYCIKVASHLGDSRYDHTD